MIPEQQVETSGAGGRESVRRSDDEVGLSALRFHVFKDDGDRRFLLLRTGMESEEAYARQNNALTILGIVHEIPNAMNGPIAARLLPNFDGRNGDTSPIFLDVLWFPENLLPGAVVTGQGHGLHVLNVRPCSKPIIQILHGMEKIGLAEEIVRRILCRRRRRESVVQHSECHGIMNNARGRVDGRGVHRAGLSLVLGLSPTQELRAADFLLHLKELTPSFTLPPAIAITRNSYSSGMDGKMGGMRKTRQLPPYKQSGLWRLPMIGIPFRFLRPPQVRLGEGLLCAKKSPSPSQRFTQRPNPSWWPSRRRVLPAEQELPSGLRSPGEFGCP